MVWFLLGNQRGYNKYPCFLCMWHIRACKKHWVEIIQPPRSYRKPADPNILHEQVLGGKNIIFLPLHIKLGLMKQLVKALPTKHHILAFLRLQFEKIKNRVVNGSYIQQLIKDEHFIRTISELQNNAWLSFKDIIRNLEIREHIIASLVETYKTFAGNMSMKVHFLHSLFTDFTEYLGAVSNEQGKRFQPDLQVNEERYQGRCE